MTDSALLTQLQVAAYATVQGVLNHSTELTLITIASVVAYAVARHYIPIAAETLFERNLFGIDINKTTPEERQQFAAIRTSGQARDKEFRAKAVPESLGIVVGGVYFCMEMILLVCLGGFFDVAGLAGPLVTVSVMLLLGFVDDVLDVRWRYKIVLSALGALPLVSVYDGSLSVLIPPTITSWISPALVALLAPSSASWWPWSSLVDHASLTVMDRLRALRPVMTKKENYLVFYIGPLYLLYIMLLCIFCTNSINILAGVNGVEVGQSVVIAMASVVYNIVQLRLMELGGTSDAAQLRGVTGSPPSELTADHQMRALAMLGPFIGVSLALWRYNRYPSRVFVGDSYTYFAGTVLAVAGITGVYTKTLFLFFLPQLFNFILSMPQLFNIVPCPRHRVPRWIKDKDVLVSSGNLTILNAILVVMGPLHESKLTRMVLLIQGASCVVGFVMRYMVSAWMYDSVQ